MSSTSSYAEKVQLIFWHQGAATIDVITNLIHFVHPSTYLLKRKCVLGAWASLYLALCLNKPVAPNWENILQWVVYFSKQWKLEYGWNDCLISYKQLWILKKSNCPVHLNCKERTYVLNTSMYFVWTLYWFFFSILRKYQYPVIWWLYETI